MDVPGTPEYGLQSHQPRATKAGQPRRGALQPRDVNAAPDASSVVHGKKFSESLARLREAETKRITSYSGWLTKKPVAHKNRRKPRGASKLRFFRLTNEALYYYRDDSCSVLRGRVAFSASTKVRLTMQPKCFELEDDAVLCGFEAASQEECDDWVCQLQREVEAYQYAIRDPQLRTPDAKQHVAAIAVGGAGNRQQSRRFCDAVLGRTDSLSRPIVGVGAGAAVIFSTRTGSEATGHGMDDGSISSILDRPSTSGASAASDDEAATNGIDPAVPSIREAMSTCKKRSSTTAQRMAAVERENEELRAALAHQREKAAEDQSTESLQEKLRKLQQLLLEQQQLNQSRDESDLQQEQLAAAAAAAVIAEDARPAQAKSVAAQKADEALLKRRMNIEAHHETCNCSIM